MTRAGAARRRGFTMVELTVSFAIFLILASVLSLALARSFSTASTAQSRTQASSALADALDKLAAVPYAKLLAGDFTVPDACPDSSAGIGGDSCVKVGTQMMRIGYGFQTSPTDLGCAVTDARRYAASYGYVKVNGCVVSYGRGAFTTQVSDTDSGLPRMTRQVNAPRPGFKAGAGTVRAQLSGRFADVPGSLVLLVHPARSTKPADGTVTAVGVEQVASGTIGANGIAVMTVDNISATETLCSTANPCALALSVGPTPTQTPAAGGALALVDTAAAGAGAGFTVAADAVTEVTARVAPVSTATFDLVSDKGGIRTPNPVPGSVCLWVTFPDIKAQRTVPVCNTDDPGKITIDTYEPGWASFGSVTASALGAALADSDSRSRFPFPSGARLKLTVDNPDGSCRYAPGMLGSRPGDVSQVGGAPTDWAPLAVCTSFTWGAPSRLEVAQASGSPAQVPFTTAGAVLQLDPDRPVSGAIVWDNPLLAPAAVGYGNDPSWDKPRTALGCTADASCTSTLSSLAATVIDPATGFTTAAYPNTGCVADGTCRDAVNKVSPESGDCPGEYCYSTVNAKPYLASPAAGTQKLNATGTTTTFTIDVRDTDDAASTITAALAAGSPPAGLSFTLGTSTTPDAHTRRYPVTVVDSSGNTSVKVVTLALSSGSGATRLTSQVDLGLYYTSGAWKLIGDAVTAKQGSVNVPVRVRVTGTDGAAYPGATVTFASTAAGVTITNAVTDASGYGTGILTASTNTPAGTFTINASLSGSGRSVPLKLTVVPVAGNIDLSVSPVAVEQGARGSITVTVTDGAGGPASGVPVTLVVTDAAGIPSSAVYPASSGCVSASTGRCTVPLVVDPDAVAGDYTLGAAAPGMTAPTQNIAVTSVPARVTSDSGISLAQGETVPGVALKVLDGSGAGMPATALTVTAPSGISVSPVSGNTDDDGTYPVAVTAAANAPLGAQTLSVKVAGRTFTVPVTVSAAYGGITSTPTTVDQGGSGVLTVRVVSGSGAPVSGSRVTFFIDQPGIHLSPSATSAADGTASAVLDIDTSAKAGTYPVTVMVDGNENAAMLVVAPVPSTVTAAGAVAQGVTSPLALTVFDLAGDPIPDLAVTVPRKPATFSLQQPSVTTDSQGQATFTVTDSGTIAGTYTVTVKAGALTVDIPVAVLAGPGQISFGATKLRLTAGSQTSLTLTVKDRAAQPYPNAEVTLTGVPDGVTASVNGRTNASGQVTATVTAAASTIGGTAPMIASVDLLTANLPLQVVGSYSATQLRAGASLLLPLDDNDGTAVDLLDRHAGTYVGGISSSFAKRQDSPLLGSQSVSFQPVDTNGVLTSAAQAYVRVTDGAADIVPTTGSFTVAAWVNPRSITSTRSGFPVQKGVPSATAPGFTIGASNSAGGLLVELGDGAKYVSTSVPLDAGSRPSDWVGKWTHVAVVFDRPAGVGRIYVNGVRQTSTVNISTVTGSVATTGQLNIGVSRGWMFDGRMDEFAIYPSALGDAQLSGLVKAATVTDPVTASTIGSGPVGYWRLGESAGTTVKATVGADGTATAATLGRPGVVTGDSSTDFTQPTATAALPTGAAATATSWTASAWFYPTATSRTVADGILTGGSPSFGNPRLTWGLSSTTGSNRVQVLWNYTPAAGGGGANIQTGAVALNTWHHLAYTVTNADTTPTVTLYLDGAQAATTTLAKPINLLGPTLAVAARDSTRSLPGRVDEVTLYDRALTAAEIASAYTSLGTAATPAAGPSYDEQAMALGPLGYWRLGEKAGPLADSSGYANPITPIPAGMTQGAPPVINDQSDAALNRGGDPTAVYAAPTTRYNTTQWSDVTWFNTNSFATTQQLAMSYTSGNDANGVARTWGRLLYIDVTSGRLRGYVGQGSAAVSWTSFITPVPVPKGVPVMAAYTFDGTTASLYVNGALSATLAVPAYAPPATAVRYWLGTGYGMNGTQDEVSTYGRALTAAEVAALYQAGK